MAFFKIVVWAIIFLTKSLIYLAPSSGPQSIDILATTTKSIRLHWNKVREKSRSGIRTRVFKFSGYTIRFSEFYAH